VCEPRAINTHNVVKCVNRVHAIMPWGGEEAAYSEGLKLKRCDMEFFNFNPSKVQPFLYASLELSIVVWKHIANDLLCLKPTLHVNIFNNNVERNEK
jgi:hypothetical protein